MHINYPTVSKDQSNKFFITFYLHNRRYRLYSSKKIGGNTHPNKFKGEEQIKMVNILAAEVYNHFKNGEKFITKNKKKYTTHKEFLKAALDQKKECNYSTHYIAFLDHVYRQITQNLRSQNLTPERLNFFLQSYTNPTSFNTVKKHLNALLEGAYTLGLTPRIRYDNKSKKIKAKLHRPFKNLKGIFSELKNFDFRLYLCCLLTYGCLLRPHREIRLLRWSDFSRDLHFINLSGKQNKSGKNRIVPTPNYIRKLLKPNNPTSNIFTGNSTPYNKSYFKNLWRLFKTKSILLKENQTLYSFRHTGAVELFKRTGSITKLQKAMGHSSMRVSLTYLRGLEVAELKEEDMPMI